jgi:phosphate:Na+ symporter
MKKIKASDTKYRFYLEMKEKINIFLQDILKTMHQENPVAVRESLEKMYSDIVSNYNKTLSGLYSNSSTLQVNQLEISKIINFNRELFTSLKSFIFSLIGCLLAPKDAVFPDDVPGFIR